MVDRSWLCDKLWQNTVLNVAKCNLGNTIDHKHMLNNGNIKKALKYFRLIVHLMTIIRVDNQNIWLSHLGMGWHSA